LCDAPIVPELGIQSQITLPQGFPRPWGRSARPIWCALCLSPSRLAIWSRFASRPRKNAN